MFVVSGRVTNNGLEPRVVLNTLTHISTVIFALLAKIFVEKLPNLIAPGLPLVNVLVLDP